MSLIERETRPAGLLEKDFEAPPDRDTDASRDRRAPYRTIRYLADETIHTREVLRRREGKEMIASSRFNSESSPNVEYGKMRSELNQCALGVDLRGIHSAFYFY